MSKSVKIQDSPEFKAFKENFEATMDAMEKDPEFAQMKLPEEWERDFKETMEATWEEERQRKKKRIGKRIAIAAGVTLVTLAGLNLGVQQVQGEGLVEFFRKTFQMNGKQYTTFEEDESFDMGTGIETFDIYFMADSLDDLNMQIRNELKCPMFYINYIPKGYSITEVSYNDDFNIINYVFKNGVNIMHMSQVWQYDNITSGDVAGDEKCKEVKNQNIDKSIIIYQSVQDNSFSFAIEMNNVYLTVDCLESLDECENVAKGIDFH